MDGTRSQGLGPSESADGHLEHKQLKKNISLSKRPTFMQNCQTLPGKVLTKKQRKGLCGAGLFTPRDISHANIAEASFLYQPLLIIRAGMRK